jgi:hypothetical protein
MSDHKRPKLNANPDWSTVQEYAVYVCDELAAGRSVPNFEQHIVTNVLEALYGPYVWSWYSQAKKDSNPQPFGCYVTWPRKNPPRSFGTSRTRSGVRLTDSSAP